MRNFFLTLFTLALFSILAYLLIADISSTTREAESPSKSSSINTQNSKESTFSLRLDTTLSTPSKTRPAPNWYQKFSKSIDLNHHKRALGLLASALVLGWLSGAALQRTTLVDTSDVSTRELSNSLNSPPLESVQDFADLDSSERNDLEAQIAMLKESGDGFKLELSEAELRLKNHESIIEELRYELSQSERISADLKQQTLINNSRANELAERDQTIEELHQDIENWRQQWASQEEQAEQLNEQIHALKTDQEHSEKRLNDLHEVTEALQKENDEYAVNLDLATHDARRASELDLELNEVVAQLEEVISKEQLLRQEFEIVQARALQADQIETDLSQATEQLNQTNEQLGDSQSQLREQEQSLKEAEQQNEGLENRAEADSTQLAKQQQEIDELAQRSDSLQIELDENQESNATLQAQLIQLQSELDQITAEKMQLRSAFSTSQDSLEATTIHNNELTEAVSQLREDLADMVTQINDKKSEIANWRERFEIQHQESEDKQQEIDNLSLSLESAESARLAAEKLKLQAQKEQQDNEYRLDNWDNTLRTYKNDIAHKNSMIDGLRDEALVNEERLDILKKQLRDIDTQLEDAETIKNQINLLTENQQHIDQNWSLQDQQIDQLVGESSQHQKKIEKALHRSKNLIEQFKAKAAQIQQSDKVIEELQHELLDYHDFMSHVDDSLLTALDIGQTENRDGFSQYSNDPDSVLKKADAVVRLIESKQVNLDKQAYSNSTLKNALSVKDKNIEEQENLAQAQASELHQNQSKVQIQAESISALKQQLSDIASDNEVKVSRIEMLSNALEEQSEKSRHYTDRIDLITRELEQERQDREAQLEENDQLRNSLEQQRLDSHEQTERVELLEQELTEATDSRLSTDAEIGALDTKLIAASEEIEQKNNKLTELTAHLEMTRELLQSQINDKDEQLTAVTDQLAQSKDQFETQLADRDKQLAEVTSQLNHSENLLQGQTEERDKELEKHYQELNNAQVLLAAQESSQQEIRHQTLQLENRIAEQDQLLAGYQKAVDDLTAAMEDHTRDIADRHKAAEALEQEIGELKEQLAASKEQTNSELENSLRQEFATQQQSVKNSHKKELLELNTLCRQLQDQLEKQKLINHKIGQRVVSLQDQLKNNQAAEKPLPVLTKKVTTGEKSSDIPKLVQPINKNNNS